MTTIFLNQFLKYVTIFSLFFVLFQPHLNAQIDSNKKAKIDALFTKWEGKENPGCALGVYQNGKLIHTKAVGVADIESKTPISATTIFRIASNSKQFTAASILLLAEQGKLKLTDNLRQFFPAFPAYADKISIQNLLNHTSGVRDYLQIAYLAGYDPEVVDDEIIRKWLVNQQNLSFETGQYMSYSNSGYWLLSEIVEKVSGMPLENYANKYIFEPLEMNNTQFLKKPAACKQFRATGYEETTHGLEKSSINVEVIGDGGIITNLQDWAKWESEFANPKVFSKKMLKKMVTPKKLNSGHKLPYANGLFVDEYEKRKTVEHSGNFAGFLSQMLRFPKEDLSIVIFSNRTDLDVIDLSYKVANILFNIPQSAKTEEETDYYEDIKAISVAESHKQFCGNYETSTGELRMISFEDGLYQLEKPGDYPSIIIPDGENEFYLLNYGKSVRIQFQKYNDGFTYELVNQGKSLGKVFPKNKESKPNQIIGLFTSQELQTNYAITSTNNQLKIKANNRDFLTLEYLGNDIWVDRANCVALKVLKNDKQENEQFELSMGNSFQQILFEKMETKG